MILAMMSDEAVPVWLNVVSKNPNAIASFNQYWDQASVLLNKKRLCFSSLEIQLNFIINDLTQVNAIKEKAFNKNQQ